MNPLFDFLKGLGFGKEYTHSFRREPVNAQSPKQPQTQGLDSQMQKKILPALRGFAGAQPIAGDQLQSSLAKARGADNPILQDLEMYINAGNQLPENIDPLLPIILAIRETQGGRFNKGQNNPYNIRGQDLGGNTEFINYPSLETATFGGQNDLYGGIQSQGLMGLIGQNDLYSDFRRTGNMQDLFKKYSPPVDSNGPLEEQVQNYNWIRNNILGIQQ